MFSSACASMFVPGSNLWNQKEFGVILCIKTQENSFKMISLSSFCKEFFCGIIKVTELKRVPDLASSVVMIPINVLLLETFAFPFLCNIITSSTITLSVYALSVVKNLGPKATSDEFRLLGFILARGKGDLNPQHPPTTVCYMWESRINHKHPPGWKIWRDELTTTAGCITSSLMDILFPVVWKYSFDICLFFSFWLVSLTQNGRSTWKNLC